VALCDVDSRQFEATQKNGRAAAPATPRSSSRIIAKCLADQTKPDIAIIGTPDHWHALPMIAAVQRRRARLRRKTHRRTPSTKAAPW
jgi:hypothetical protein